MSDLTPTPQFEEEIRATVGVPQARPEFIENLHARLLKQTATLPVRASRPVHSRSAWMAASIVFVALTVVILLIGPQDVLAAVRGLFGYIPGFGFTSNVQSVYFLPEPVNAVNGDLALRIDQAVSDESKFWVNMTATGLPEEQDFSQAFVVLPDGEKIPFQMGSSTIGDSNAAHLTYVFPALPAATRDLVLLIENLGGQNFNVSMQLRPAQAGDVLPAEPEPSVQLRSQTIDGLTLVLDHVAPAGDKTIFQVSLDFDKPGMSLNTDWNIVLKGQDGKLYPAIDITPEMMAVDGSAKIFQTLPFTGNEQLILSLTSFPDAANLPVSIDFSVDDANRFLFDPGDNPVVGQSWPLDEVIQVGDFTLRTVRANLTSPTELQFEFEPAGNLTGVILYTPDPLVRGAASGVPQADGKILARMIFEKIPDHPFEVQVTRAYYTAHGSWEIQWQPPAAPQGIAAQPAETSIPSNQQMPTATLVSSDPLVLEVQRLAQQFDTPFQQGPAWIHEVTERRTNPSPGQSFPPPYLISEQWFETDADGYVIRSVWMDKDINGNTIQLSATVGDYSVNFTTGDAGFNNGQLYRFSTDMVTRGLAQAEQNGVSVTREEVTGEDGQPCIVITSKETFAQSNLSAGETQEFIGAGYKVWINLATGQQFQYQSFWQLEDGTDRIESTFRNLLVEKVSAPPQEILDILAKVMVP